MSEHIRPSSQEEVIIRNAFRREKTRGRWPTKQAKDRELVGTALHVLKDHPEDDFSEQMYRHIAATCREELPRVSAPGDTVDVETWHRLTLFIKEAIG